MSAALVPVPVAPPAPPRRSSSRSTTALAVLGLGLLVTFAACSRPAHEFGALQAGVIERSGCEWERQIRLGIPAGLFSLARVGLHFVELEPEVRAALETMRGLRVAIYQLARGTADRAGMLAAADAAMLEQGWERLVGVLDRKELVAVFLPAHPRPGNLLDLCVVVFDGRQLVLVSGRADPEPLVELALRQIAGPRDELFARSRSRSLAGY